MDYKEFLKTKEVENIHAGFDIDRECLNPKLFDFQKDIVKWALKKGRCAVLIGCGCGKTAIQLEWANKVCEHTKGNVLILAPLSVVRQTQKEGIKFGIDVTVCRTQDDVKDGINIVNYEMVEHFNASKFVGVVLDESSILKSFTSKTKVILTEKFSKTPYRLLCTATIAPNDYTEIGTSCEFLGIMSRSEMLATYFVHDGGSTADWRLKKHGRNKFWEWFATWAIYFNSPADLGYETKGYDLPELHIQEVVCKSKVEEYEMFVRLAETLEERRLARKESMEDRTDKAAEFCNNSDEPWVVWCDFNNESSALKQKIENSVEVKGSDTPEYKADSASEFAENKIHALVSKPSIYSFGLNWQNCHNMIFCGLSDSYEQFYQAVRRCWRFGQTEEVNVYIIISEKEQNVIDNIKRKQSQMDEMQVEMVALMKSVTLAEIQHTTRITETYKPEKEFILPNFL
jgi:hypothetical protein